MEKIVLLLFSYLNTKCWYPLKVESLTLKMEAEYSSETLIVSHHPNYNKVKACEQQIL
jgi:hypothetical protein